MEKANNLGQNWTLSCLYIVVIGPPCRSGHVKPSTKTSQQFVASTGPELSWGGLVPFVLSLNWIKPELVIHSILNWLSQKKKKKEKFFSHWIELNGLNLDKTGTRTESKPVQFRASGSTELDQKLPVVASSSLCTCCVFVMV